MLRERAVKRRLSKMPITPENATCYENTEPTLTQPSRFKKAPIEKMKYRIPRKKPMYLILKISPLSLMSP